MKKVVKKITTEVYQNGELVKRIIEETIEETKYDQVFPNKVGDSTSPWIRPDQVKWATTTGNDNMVLLRNEK